MNDEAPPSASASRDPFYVVRDKVVNALKSLKVDHERFKELLSTTNTATNAEFQQVHTAIKQNIAKLKTDVIDLNKTVDIVEKNRARFKNIDDAELDKRKKFVNETRMFLQEIVDTLKSERTKKRLEDDKTRAAAAPALAPSARDRAAREEAESYVKGRTEQHQQLVEDQDEALDDIQSALSRLGDVAGAINTELDIQKDMLDDVNNEMDNTHDQMNSVMQKMDKLLKSSDRGKLCCIFILSIVVVILFFIIIYG